MSDTIDLFVSLDDIDWASLEHAYGPGDKVPDWLRALRAAELEQRDQGRYWLEASILHQGSVYPASAPAVPFLVRLALDRVTPERDWIVRFLAGLAVSDPGRWLRAGFDLRSPRLAGYFDPEEAAPYRDAYRAVEAAIPDLIGLLDDDDPSVRTAAPYPLAFFAHHTETIRPALHARLREEQHPAAIASVAIAAALLDGYAGDVATQALLRPHLDGSVRTAATVAIALSYGSGPGKGDADPAALPILDRFLRSAEAVEPWAELPWRDGNLGRLAIDAVFKQIPPPEHEHHAARVAAAQDIYFALMEAVDEHSPPAAIDLALDAMRPLFATVTPEPPPEAGWTLETLRPTLRRFAEATARRPFLASRELFDVFRENALPDDLAPLRDFLGIHEPGPLDAEITLGEEAHSVSVWISRLTGDDVPDRLINAIATRPDAVDIAFALVSQRDGTQVGKVGTTSFSLSPGPSAAPARNLGEAIADAAVERDAATAYAAALALAEAHADTGPPRSYGRVTQIHTPALTLLCRVAAAACAHTGEVPDPAFDLMTQGQLGDRLAWPTIAAYLEHVPEQRLARFLLELSKRRWKPSWGSPFPISLRDVLSQLMDVLPQEAREGVLVDTVGSGDWRTVLPIIVRYPSTRVLEAVTHRLADDLEGMKSWAADRLKDQIEQDARALGRLGPWAYGALRVAAEDPARSGPVFARALELLDQSSQVGAAVRNAGVAERDERGLMPLEEARALVGALDVYVKGDFLPGTNILESDRAWAALLSLEDAAELVEHAERIDWRFHVRGRDNTALLERYGEDIMPWIEHRLDDRGVLFDIPWCVVPCLLQIPSRRALELALATYAVHQQLPGQPALGQGPGAFAVDNTHPEAGVLEVPAPDRAPTAGLDLARRWIAAHPTGYGLLAELAEAGSERAIALLRDRAEALGGPVSDALVEALGAEAAERLVTRFELPRSILPPEVQAALEDAPRLDEPRGPLWSIGELDQAAARYELPLWDNANFTTGAMRITGFASRHGDVLLIESLVTWPSAGEPIVWEATAFGPGATRRSKRAMVVREQEVASTWLDDTDYINGVTNHLHTWGERDADGRLLEGSRGARIVPVPLPPEYLLVGVLRPLVKAPATDVKLTYHLPKSFEVLNDVGRAELPQVSPGEGLLAQLCDKHVDRMWPFARDLRPAFGIPDGAIELFSFQDFEYVWAGQRASESVDLLAMVEALRTRRTLDRLPGTPNSRPPMWYAACAEIRSFAGPEAWAPGDGPIEPTWPADGAGCSPYWNELLARGWPHGVMLMHGADYNQAGMAEQTIPYLAQMPNPVMRVFWPRRTACIWARAVAGADAAISPEDPGVTAALERDALVYPAEAALLLATFVSRDWDPPPHVGAELVGILEALCGGTETVLALAAALAAAPPGTWERDRPAVAAAVFESGFVLRRMPLGGDQARAALEPLDLGAHDVGRAMDLILHGRAGAERSARTALDYAHVADHPDWARSRILDPATPAGAFDAALMPLGGDALLDQLADRLADEPDPAWTATQLATLGAPRATALLLALYAGRADLRPTIGPTILGRPSARAELELALRGPHSDAARELLSALRG